MTTPAPTATARSTPAYVPAFGAPAAGATTVRAWVRERGPVEEPIDKLTAAMATGDAGAVERFYRRYFDRLYGWAKHFALRDESFCLDVVHDAVLRIVRTIRRADTEAQLLAWLRLVVQTTAYDRLKADRRRARREQPVMVPADEGPTVSPADEAAMDREQIEWLRRQIADLDPQLARMLDLRYSAGWTLARIGRLFGLSAGSVDGRLRRTLRRLRQASADPRSGMDVAND